MPLPPEVPCECRGCHNTLTEGEADDLRADDLPLYCDACRAQNDAEDAADRKTDEWLERRAGL